MTIIEYMRQKLTEYPKISEFLTGDDIHIDFTEPDPVNLCAGQCKHDFVACGADWFVEILCS